MSWAAVQRSEPALCVARRNCMRWDAGLVIENLRGNVDTRLRKLDEGQYDAIVLAAAGLRRLGWADRIRELIEPEVMCPAAGQGALAIETRDDGGAATRSRASSITRRPMRR